jgi:hypothetical protein
VNYPKGYLGISHSYVSPAYITAYNSLYALEGVRVTGFDLTVPKYFNFFDIITQIESVPIGALNNQYPLFSEIHLRGELSTVSVSYRPYISTFMEYGGLSTTSVTLSAFNPTSDKFLSTSRYTPVNPFL